MTNGNIEGAYGKLQGWYKDASGRAPKPTYQDAKATRMEYEKLFTREEPPGESIPIHIHPRPRVDDEPPQEWEVVAALKKMRLNKSPGASGIRVEDLRSWWNSARKAEVKDPKCVELWEKVLTLVNLVFAKGEIPSAFCNGILVLIPKTAQGEYRGIALLEIVYKLVSAIINRRLADAIQFHDAIHGFRAGRGTGTAIIEVKLLMQLAKRSSKPLYMVFLDLKKAYDTLDRGRTLEILEGYGVGANLRRIISRIWDGDTMVPKQSGYFGEPFRASRGVRQGDIVSPIIFNIIADAVIRDWEVRMGDGREMRRETKAQFYADDGLLSGEDPTEVQRGLDILTDLFARVGLKMNATKTEAMIMTGGKVTHRISDEAYVRRLTGTGLSHRERSLQKVICDLCGASVNRQHLKKHQTRATCRKARQEPRPAVVEVVAELPRSNEEREPRTYRVSVPGEGSMVNCPVEGCIYHGHTPGAMRMHFRNRHAFEDTIIVEEEGLLPRCMKCGLFQRDVGRRHQASRGCQEAQANRQRFLDSKVQETAREVVFMVNGVPIKTVREFKYLGRMLEDNDDDLPAVERNLKRARQKWGRISRILSKKSARPKAMATFYKAIVQSVLLYGSESWVLSKCMWRKLRSFHRRCARYITGRHIRENADGTWTCPGSASTLEEAGLWTIEEYIERRKATVMVYAGERSIYRRCKSSTPLASSVNQLVWWDTSTDA